MRMQTSASSHPARPSAISAVPIPLLPCLCLAAATLLNGCATDRNGSKANPLADSRPTAHPATLASPAPTSPTTANQPGAGTATTADSGSEINGWNNLFDGQTLKGWKITDFAGRGEVTVENGQVLIHSGVMLTGMSWTNAIPKIDYEVSLEAMKVDGSDFFCGLTFPVEDAFCTWIVGGWGGGVVGLSSIDGLDASENETTKYMKVDTGHWYRLRLRVTKQKIEAWMDDEKIVDQPILGRRISLRPGDIDLSKPFGVATWQTTGALRAIKIRRLTGVGGKETVP